MIDGMSTSTPQPKRQAPIDGYGQMTRTVYCGEARRID